MLLGDRDTSHVYNMETNPDKEERGWGRRFEAPRPGCTHAPARSPRGGGWGKWAVCWGNVQKQKMGERRMGGRREMVFSRIRELNRLPQLKQDEGRAGAWVRVGGCNRVLRAGWHKKPFSPQAHSPPRGQGCIQPPSPQGPPGSTGSALAILVRAPALPQGFTTTTHPCLGGHWHNHPPRGANLPGLDGVCFPGCLGQTCSVLAFASQPRKSGRTDHLQPEPTPQALSWVGNKSPPAPAKQIHVCLAKSFCFSC